MSPLASGRGALSMLAVCAVVLGACRKGEVPPVVLDVHTRTNENVSLAARGDVVVATWSAAPDLNSEDVYAAVSTDGAVTFSPPVRVNGTPGQARVNGEQPPRSVLVDRGGGVFDILVMWTANGQTGTRFLSARSGDGGRTFVPAELPAGANAQGNRGWAMIEAAGSGGRVDAVWLDHRRLTSSSGSTAAAHTHDHGHQSAHPAMDTVDMAQLSDLYFAALAGGDASQPARPVAAGVCYCCKTAMAHGPDGAIYLAWRHVYPGDLRDIAFTVSRDAGLTFATPVRVHEDAWSIKGCPDDGPAMAVDMRGRVHLVWPTMVDVSGQMTKTIRYSMTTDGRSFTEPVRLPADTHAHHPQVAILGDGSVAVAWDETRDNGRFVARARGKVGSDGRVTFTRDASFSAQGSYPTLARAGDRLLMAWSGAETGAMPTIKIHRWR